MYGTMNLKQQKCPDKTHYLYVKRDRRSCL